MVLLLGGCAEQGSKQSRLDSVTPALVQQGEGAEISLSGSFAVDPFVSFEDEKRSRLDARYSVRLGDTELGEATYVSSTELTVDVPVTLAAGVYDVTVIDPGGRERDGGEPLGSWPSPSAGCLYASESRGSISVPIWLVNRRLKFRAYMGLESAAQIPALFDIRLALVYFLKKMLGLRSLWQYQ